MDPVEELLTRGVEQVYPSKEALGKELRSGRRLKIYMGIDPTGKSLHIGHVVQLHKLRRFQDLGHEVILLIGDFTGMIGDPTDKKATRVKLTREQVLENAKDYLVQAGKILDTDSLKLKYNSKWLSKLTFADVVELAAELTVQQMIKRSMFQERIKSNKPIGLHEFLYPLMQAYDSVAMGIDVEVGGSDQIFNMLVGADMVRRHLGKQKYVLAGKLLADKEGEKVGKTRGKKEEILWLSDSPLEMFQKVMLWPDGIIALGFELCTRVPMEKVAAVKEKLAQGANPLEIKEDLAETIVSELANPEEAKKARRAYKNHKPENAPAVEIAAGKNGVMVTDVLVEAGLAKSKKAARRLIQQGGVKIDGKKIDDGKMVLRNDFTVQVGKKATSIRRVKIKA